MIILDKIREKERKKIRKEIIKILAIHYQRSNDPNEKNYIGYIAEDFGVAEEVLSFPEIFKHATLVVYKNLF